VAFLDAEFARLPGESRCVAGLCKVLDTLALARRLHPGQRNGLDALCKRYSVDNSKRELHGALLDAGILVDVYLAMTGGQSALALDVATGRRDTGTTAAAASLRTPGVALAVPAASEDELRRHDEMLDLLHKASGGKALWRRTVAPDGDGTHRNH
jgi:DNA polymerase-3 subunit epsilon